MASIDAADRAIITRRLIAFLVGVLLAVGIAWYWPALAGAQAALAGPGAPLAMTWQGSTLIIVTGPPAGCLWLIGAGRLDTPLPDSCGVDTYTIGYPYLDQNYSPIGRTLIKYGYDGQELARVAIRHYAYMPAAAAAP